MAEDPLCAGSFPSRWAYLPPELGRRADAQILTRRGATQETANMPPIFGRNIPNPHPYDTAIADWRSTSDSTFLAIARNLMHDHRVSPTREEWFDRHTDHPRTASQLSRALVDYFEDRIRTRLLPDYVYEAANRLNILSGTSSGSHVLHKDLDLIRVLDLNGLRIVFQFAKAEGISAFRSFPSVPTDANVHSWLDSRLDGQSTRTITTFVRSTLGAMNEYRHRHPFQPTWATAWKAFEPHAPLGANRWLEVLGVSKPDFPRWVIALRYPVREAGTVARPTQLDAGWSCYHFPSPPQALLQAGGHPMDARVHPSMGDLIPEFIHKQIDHDVSHWQATGELCERTTSAIGGDLGHLREAHHELLLRTYGADVLSWMPECM
jgi:hypothetical protein